MTRSFFDDYEDDYIEIWDEIEKLQKDLATLRRQLRALALHPPLVKEV